METLLSRRREGRRPDMTFQQIQYIEAVALSGSISRAAGMLYVAQSSVSAAVKEVEKEYGLQIFERTPKGVVLTRSGQEFLTDIKYISNYYHHVDGKYKRPPDRDKRFSLSALHHVCGDAPFLELLRKNHDKSYHFDYLEGDATFVFDNVASGKSDIGIVFFTESAKGTFMRDLHKRGLVFHHLAYCFMHIYIHNSHPLAKADSVKLKQVTPYPFVTYDNLTPDAAQYTISFQHRDKSIQILHVSDRAAAYSILRVGQAYATGSGYRSIDECYHDIISIPIVDLEKIEVGWLVKDRTALSELAIEYLDLLKGQADTAQ